MAKQAEIISVYVVRTAFDKYGRIGEVVCVTTSKAEAEECAKGQGWWGSEGAIRETHAIAVDRSDPTTVFLLQDAVQYPLSVDLPKLQKERRAAAIAKLTSEERLLLGVKE